MEERSVARRFAFPLCDQRTEFWLGPEDVAKQVFFSGDHGFWFLLVFREAPNQGEQRGNIFTSCGPNDHLIPIRGFEGFESSTVGKGTSLFVPNRLDMTRLWPLRCLDLFLARARS